MIERRYTGIAKQGADVVANPTLDGSEQALNSIQINGENFKIGSNKLKELVVDLYGTHEEATSCYFDITDLFKFDAQKLYLIILGNDGMNYPRFSMTILTYGENFIVEPDTGANCFLRFEEWENEGQIVLSFTLLDDNLSFGENIIADELCISIYELPFSL